MWFWLCWLSRKIRHTSTLKPTKTEPSFRKLNSPPTKLCMLFPTHLQARELCPQTYSLSLPLERSQVTHIPASIKSGGTYNPEKSAFYSTFARQLGSDVTKLGHTGACALTTRGCAPPTVGALANYQRRKCRCRPRSGAKLECIKVLNLAAQIAICILRNRVQWDQGSYETSL